MAIDDNTSYELTGRQVKDLANKVKAKADSSSLASVATSGLYSDLIGAPTIPTVYNGTLTIQQNGTSVGTFTANQSTNSTADITVPTKTSDLTNDGDGTTGSAYVSTTDTGTVTSAMIADGTIIAGDLASNSVTTAKIANSAVTSAKIDWTTINLYNYSTSEKAIGTWINGRTIYRKVITGTTTSAAGEAKTHGISNLSAVIRVYGFIQTATNESQPIQRVVPDNISTYGIGIGDFKSTAFWFQHPTSTYQNKSYAIVLEYIKTS